MLRDDGLDQQRLILNTWYLELNYLSCTKAARITTDITDATRLQIAEYCGCPLQQW